MKAPQPNAQPQTIKVKVLRPFQNHKREVLAKDSFAELPRVFALEMQAAKKVEILPEEPEPAPIPIQVPPKPEADQKTERKGARNAA